MKSWIVKCEQRTFVVYADSKVDAREKFWRERDSIRSRDGRETLRGKKFDVTEDRNERG